MGWFDKLFGTKPPPPPPPAPTDERAPGWDAIEQAFLARYPGQTNPPHMAPLVHRMHDLSKNAAAFDGISAYDAGAFWHYVGFGLTELYAKENADTAVSGFGYELTLRVPKRSPEPPRIGFQLLEAIGKSVWAGSALGPGHTIKTGPIDGQPGNPLQALLILEDPAFPGGIDTPHGHVAFLMLLGVEPAVRERVLAAYAANPEPGWEAQVVAELRATNPDLVTPLGAE